MPKRYLGYQCQKIHLGCQNFATMANLSLGDGRKLGKNLPQHRLMQCLLDDNFGKRKNSKINIGTQTDFRRTTSEISCCCGQRKSPDCLGNGLVHKRVRRLDDNRTRNQTYEKLLKSIREKVAFREKEESFCSCSGSWSDTSNGDGDSVPFPKETRNAMSLLLSESRHRRPPLTNPNKSSKSCAWPGVAERTNCSKEKRIINGDEITPKIIPKLSKNKLEIN